jgi:hypothetical protein
MRSKSSSAKKPAEQVVKDIRWATRRHFSAEDKIRIVLDEFFRLKMRETFYGSVEALQSDLDAWLVHYNTERPYLGYRNRGRHPIETINLFVSQEA